MKSIIFVVCLFIVFFCYACNQTPEPGTGTIDFASIGNSPKPGLKDSVTIPLSKLRAFQTDQPGVYALTWEEIDGFVKHDFNRDAIFHTENYKAPSKEDLRQAFQSMACGLNCGHTTYLITGVPAGSTCNFSNYCCTVSNPSFGSRSVCCDQ